MNLSGHRQSSIVSIELDGLRDAFKMQLILPNAEEQKSMPKDVDLILPVEQLFTPVEAQKLSVHKDGYLGFIKLKEEIDITSNDQSSLEFNISSKHDPNETPSYVYRFNDLVNIEEAFPNRVIAERVDLKNRVELHWFPPLIKLPKTYGLPHQQT